MLTLEEIGVSYENGRAIHLGASPLLLKVIERLGIEELIDEQCPSGQQKVSNGKAALAIVLSRLLNAKALYKIEDWLSESGLATLLGCEAEKFNDDLLRRMLDAVSEQSEALWVELVGRAFAAYPELVGSFIHYDVTSTYFEGEYINSLLAKRGYSRDHRSDAKQVNLGVSVFGESNFPVMYELLAGNQADCKTPLSHMAKLKALFAAVKHTAKVVVVGDRAMFNRKLIAAYLEQDVKFLGPWTPSEVRDIVSEVEEAELMAHPLAFQPQSASPEDPPTYYGALRTLQFKHREKVYELTVLVLYSRGKAKLDRDRRDDHLQTVEDGLGEIQSKLNVRRYRKKCYVQERIKRLFAASPDARGLLKYKLTGRDGALRLSVERDEEAIKKAGRVDGRYALVTNAGLSADEMLKAFKGQCRAEQRFHVLKGPLRLRPIHVRSDRRIAALVFLSMVALVVYTVLEWLVRRRTPDRERPWTGRAILEAFEELTVTACVADNGSILWMLPILSLQQDAIWQALELPPLRTWLLPRMTRFAT
jgi:transposase